MDPSAALHTIGDALAVVRLASHAHDVALSWAAYNLTAVSSHNHWTGAGLQRLVTDPPMSYDHWAHLPAWRVRRLLDARALGYIGDAHLAELGVVLVAVCRLWYLRRRARALRRTAARAAGWPSPHPWLAGGRGPAQPGLGSGLALAGVIGLARLTWLGVRLPFMVMGAASTLPALVAAHGGGSGTPAARSTVKGKEDKPLKALRRDGWLTADGWPVGTVGRGLGRRTVTINHELQCAHVMVSGSPGTGKSKTQLVPWVFSELRLPERLRASLIVLDPKPDAELTNTTMAVMERAGWRTWVYDPFAAGSMRINALGLCADSEEVEAIVDAWVIGVIGVDHPTVGQPTKRVLASVAVHLRAVAGEGWARVSLADVARFIADDEDGADCLSLAGIKEKAKGITAMDGARDATRVLLNPHVAASMAGNDWDTAAMIDAPTAIYVPITMGKRTSTRPFFMALFPLMFGEFTRVSHGRPLKRRVRILADEFASMSPVKNFDDFISASRYLDVGVAIASQGVSDIKVMYPSTWSRIEASLTTRLHLPRKGVAIIGQEAMPPIVVATRFWQRDRLMVRRVRLGQRRLNKTLALARQARYQARQIAAPAGPVALIEGPRDGEFQCLPALPRPAGSMPHDGDTRPLDTAVYTAITEPLTRPAEPLPGEEEEEEVGLGPMNTSSTSTTSTGAPHGDEEEGETDDGDSADSAHNINAPRIDHTSARARNTWEERRCARCGSPFSTPTWSRGTYCSAACRELVSRARRTARATGTHD